MDIRQTALGLGRLVDELFPARSIEHAGARSQTDSRGRWPSLPYTIGLARSPADLAGAIALRRESYRRHFGETFDCDVEPADREPGNLLFIAKDKRDRSVVGTARFSTNCLRNLQIESQIDLQPLFGHSHLADVRRLAVASGARGRLVKLGLFKATWLAALSLQIRHIVIAARGQLQKDYLNLGFVDPAPTPVLLDLLGHEHRLLALDVTTTQQAWREREHPLYRFIVNEFHPDIDLFRGAMAPWVDSRIGAGSEIEASSTHSKSRPAQAITSTYQLNR
ncbi:MAG: hypothetical protein AB7P21_05990 [Lautropia sp.]